jgi:hypothetical protein
MLEIAAACRSDSTQPPARDFGQISFALILESMTIGDHAVGRLMRSLVGRKSGQSRAQCVLVTGARQVVDLYAADQAGQIEFLSQMLVRA